MNARITHEITQGCMYSAAQFDTADDSKCPVAKRVSSQSTAKKSIRPFENSPSGTNGDLANGAQTNEYFPLQKGDDNAMERCENWMGIYLEDRPRRRREVQLHGTRIPQKMSEQPRVVEWRNENKQLASRRLAGEVGHRKESVSEESPLLQRRFPVRGEAAAGPTAEP